MRLLLLALLLFSYSAKCQVDSEEDPLVPRVLALDTSVQIAQRFSEAMGKLVENYGYTLAFIDNETRYNVRYVYKNPKNESLRVDYGFEMESPDEEKKLPKRAVVNYQRISGELQAITLIYNFLFGATLTPERVMSYSTQGSPMSYRGRKYQFTFLPDDFAPGYWMMTFTH